MLEKYIDGRGELWYDWVEKFLELGWVRKHLSAGDFLFYTQDERSVGIEAKTVQDITSRLTDARRELAHLIDMVEIPILLIFGKWNRKSNDILLGGQDQLTWGRLWNIIQTFQDTGLRVQICTSREHALLRINQLFAYYQKGEHTSFLIERRAGGDRRIASLMCIPGVAKKLGKSLMDHFGTLHSISEATEEDLQGIPLIGLSKAKVIRDWFHREVPYR